MTKAEAKALGAHCHQCPLGHSGVIVPPSPVSASRKLRLVIVGEGPTRTDEARREVFQGLTGRVLDTALKENGIDRRDCHVTNTALCRGDSDKENERAAQCCAPRLLRELSELGADMPILTLGKAPTVAVLGVRSILVVRGFIWTAKELDKVHVKGVLKKAHNMPPGAKRDNAILRGEILQGRMGVALRTVLPTLHPSFVLRADTWNCVWKIDMARVGRIVLGKVGPREDTGSHNVGAPSKVLRRLGPIVSCDIETTGIDPMTCDILCVGFSDGERTAVVWPWKSHYAAILSKWMRTRKAVVFHNGI